MNTEILYIGKESQTSELLTDRILNITISTIGNINELLDYISSNNIDIIINTIEDKFLDEISILEQLKKDKLYNNLQILVIDKSPFPIPNNIQLAFRSGIDDYIKGEPEEVELISRVENLINKHKKISELLEENSVNKEALSLMDRLLLFVDKADNSFIVFDNKGEIEWVNNGFNRMYGYTIDEFKRKFGRTIYEASNNSEIKAKVDNCIRTKETINYVSEFQAKSGKYKWVQTTFTPIISNGKIEQFIAIETDITKLKETEEELNQKNEYMLALTNHLKSSNTLLETQQQEINKKNKALEIERKKSEDLLLNILPFEVARQLKSKGVAKPKDYKLTTVLFLDFVNFTQLANDMNTSELVNALDSYFKAFDDIVDKHFIEKIKTIGDAYMCAGGLPLRNRSNPFNVVLAGLEMQKIVEHTKQHLKTESGLEWHCRIGIHTGHVIAGVVGKKKYIYDIWGHTVNIAARMQEEGASGKVNISGDTYERIKDYFDCSYRGKIKMKHEMSADMYFVNRLKPAYSADPEGLTPNETFIKMLNSL